MSNIISKRLDEVVYTVFDFETTGMSYENGDKVVELAFAKYSLKDGIIEEFSSLINPGIPIPWNVSNIHGIYDKDVVNAPTFVDLTGNILSIIDGTILVGHKVYFDLKFIEGEMSEIGITIKHPHICTMGFSGFFGRKSGQSLLNVCNDLGINLKNAHTALADVKATIALLERHIHESISNGFYTFGDLKKTKKKYKFISSWDMPIPSYKSATSNHPHGIPHLRTNFPSACTIQKTIRPAKFVYDDLDMTIRLHCNPYNDEVVDLLRNLPKRTYEPEYKEWVIPYQEDYEYFLRGKFSAIASLSFRKFNNCVRVTLTPKSGLFDKEGCYIASAIYGSYEAPEVLVLRNFRDTILKKCLLGRLFIAFYYTTSPRVAKILKGKKRINRMVKL
ncbi:MAG: PolC-type DNA polymerase III, partial [bacterium]